MSQEEIIYSILMTKLFCKRWKKTKVWRHECWLSTSMPTNRPLLDGWKGSEKDGNWLNGSQTNSRIIARPSESASSANCLSEMNKIHSFSSSSPEMSHGYSSKPPNERRCASTVTKIQKAFQIIFTTRRLCDVYGGIARELSTGKSSLKFANKRFVCGVTTMTCRMNGRFLTKIERNSTISIAMSIWLNSIVCKLLSEPNVLARRTTSCFTMITPGHMSNTTQFNQSKTKDGNCLNTTIFSYRSSYRLPRQPFAQKLGGGQSLWWFGRSGRQYQSVNSIRGSFVFYTGNRSLASKWEAFIEVDGDFAP